MSPPTLTRNHLYKLAIFGEKPVFLNKHYVGRPNIGNRKQLLMRIKDLLDRRWLTNDGPYLKEFECKVALFIGVKHCVAVCNATVGLEILVRALNISGEVIIPSFTFIATAHALNWQGLTPVFCDIDPYTHNIAPSSLERLITPRTTGIIGVHLWGRPCNVEALTKIAKKHKLKLIFDAAHAFGSSYNGKMIGGFGDAEVFSFHATKVLNTFEGGIIATNDDRIAQKVRLMRDFGFLTYDTVCSAGTNGKMNEVSAAMGLTGFESLDKFIKINYKNYKIYQKNLKDIPGVSLITYDQAQKCNYSYIVIEINKNSTKINRDQLLKILWAENIIARRYFYPGCHRQEPYRSKYNESLKLKNTDMISQKILCLPTGTTITAQDINKICQIIRIAVGHGEELSKKISCKSKQVI
jgi:dTDP-4-amino-4,6-dideoxygalactose transaminase